jgi:hypothetical protein
MVSKASFITMAFESGGLDITFFESFTGLKLPLYVEKVKMVELAKSIFAQFQF